MKTILFFTLIFSSTVFARTTLTMKEFDKLSLDQQVKVISAYKDFLRESSAKTEPAKFSSIRFSFITEAFAAGEFDCFYAGWPSRSSRSGGKRLCSSPITGNPDYPSRASTCGANSLLCQPAIFGSGLCVSVATSALRNSAFSQCESRFRASGKTLADVAAELNTPEKRADLEELVGVTERICREGFQKPLCNRLREKLLAVRNQIDPTLLQAAQDAVRVTERRVEPEVDCDPNTPGIQTQPSATRGAPQQAAALFRRACPRPPLSGAAPDLATLTPSLTENGMQIVAGTPTDTRMLARFMEEFNKFPQPLREEMKRNGSRVNLIFGQGVTEDPSWAAEAARAARPADWVNTHDGRPWSEVPGSGGSMGAAPTPTRIVVNRMYEGHGATSLFLHEYAHTLDSMYGEHVITASPQWQQALARDTRATEFINSICGRYCNDTAHPEEAFAELFAYYHACDLTKNHLRAFMPSIANFFDRLATGTVRDLLDGRINMDPPVPQIAEVAPRQDSAIVVSSDRAASNERVSATAVAGISSDVESDVPGPRVAQVERRSVAARSVPDEPQSRSGSTIGPSQALAMVSSGQLTYHGRGLLPGSDTVGSCVYSNADVYVIIHACRRDGREAPATNIDIITRDGQKTNFYIENSEQTDRTVGLPSQIRRENYDRAWRISYQQLGPVPTNYSLDAMRTYLQDGVRRVGDNCYVGGVMTNEATALCNGNLINQQNSWGPGANAFFTQPGDAWYSFLRTMRQKVQSNAGR